MLNIFADKKIDVSVLVPVFGTEGTLLRCLESVKKQVSDLFYIEIVVVDDCSNGRDGEGRSCREIVKAFKKSCSLPVKYVRHEQNKGAFESRRTAVYESKGRWLFMLDSDDYLKENSLAEIYRHAKETGAQIIHADAELITSIGGDFQKEMAEKVHNIHFGALNGQQIIQHFLIDMDITGFMWGKLYDRELIMNALEHIPLVSCTMAEDYLLFFWLAYECSVKEYTDEVARLIGRDGILCRNWCYQPYENKNYRRLAKNSFNSLCIYVDFFRNRKSPSGSGQQSSYRRNFGLCKRQLP